MKRALIIFLTFLSSCTAINKANKFYNDSDYTAAIQQCQKIIESDSLNAEAHYILGKCYHAHGKIEETIRSLSTAYYIRPQTKTTIKAKSELIAAKLEFADTLLGREKKSLALEELHSVLELDSANTIGLIKLGDFYKESGYLDKAKIQYLKLLEFEHENQLAKDRINQIKQKTVLAEQDYQQGKQKFEKYHYYDAVKYLKKALHHKPDHKDAQYYLAMAQGSILYKKGNKTQLWEAIEQFGKASMLRTGSGEPHYYMALAYEKKDRREFNNAIHEYQLAIEKEPNGFFANHCLKKIKELTKLRDRLKKFWGK